MDNKDIQFAFFGTPKFSVDILDKLEEADLLPSLVVTAPDRKSGRGQELSPPPVAKWAHKRDIETLQPESINNEFIDTLKEKSPENGWPVFVVIAYGQILPPELIYLPEHNTLNVHPSLLPKVRGAAPIRGTILNEDKAGVTIIELDEKMDHGPIVAQKEVETNTWPPQYPDLKETLTKTGGRLLADTLPKWVNDDITATPQDHDKATYIEKFSSDDGEIDLEDDPDENLRKIRAFTNWPKAHFFTNKDSEKVRVLITAAHKEAGELVIDTVKPAGKEKMDYQQFQENFAG